MLLVDMWWDKNLLVNCQINIPIMLRAAGFENIHTVHRSVPVGRQDEIDGCTNIADFLLR